MSPGNRACRTRMLRGWYDHTSRLLPWNLKLTTATVAQTGWGCWTLSLNQRTGAETGRAFRLRSTYMILWFMYITHSRRHANPLSVEDGQLSCAIYNRWRRTVSLTISDVLLSLKNSRRHCAVTSLSAINESKLIDIITGHNITETFIYVHFSTLGLLPYRPGGLHARLCHAFLALRVCVFCLRYFLF